jgi:3-deoxy-D-manno-octulosonate 8-phosphate phosphatase (KDO 8-P phosphatase)
MTASSLPGVDQAVAERARAVRLLCLDVDGVLTDGRLLLGDNGVEYKAFFSRDGHGIKMAMSAEVDVAVITGRRSEVVAQRMQTLGVQRVFQGHERKLPVFRSLLEELGLQPHQAAYVGDDVLDLPVMREVGLAVAVADADVEVRRRAHWITPSPGGRGAVRETCELLLHAQGRYREALQRWLGDGF